MLLSYHYIEWCSDVCQYVLTRSMFITNASYLIIPRLHLEMMSHGMTDASSHGSPAGQALYRTLSYFCQMLWRPKFVHSSEWEAASRSIREELEAYVYYYPSCSSLYIDTVKLFLQECTYVILLHDSCPKAEIKRVAFRSFWITNE